MKPICENIGLDWEAQRQKIHRNQILNSTACMIKAVAQDGKNRENLCLPLEYLNGWLFGVDAARVKPQIRERLLQYQRECFKVLNAHFNRQPERACLPADFPNTGDAIGDVAAFLAANPALVQAARGNAGTDKEAEAAQDAVCDILLAMRYAVRLMAASRDLSDHLALLRSPLLTEMRTTADEMRRPMRRALNWLEGYAAGLPPSEFYDNRAAAQRTAYELDRAYPPAAVLR